MARRILPADLGVTVLLVDSITEINGDDAGCLVISGSHGGRSAARYAAAVVLAGCVFNDAGTGKDDAGIAGLAALAYPALACSHRSARIGDPQDAWDNGIVSAVNAAAQAAGLRSGMTVQAAFRQLAGG
ncbi:hypothetical protein [Ferrovibrio xuzhouensis]|uniref:Glycerate kinase n=1 Tax=Ferrovibrio xuzhouensis TaxID=1576914 RepID=A0ABV7VLQ2_9PROT